MKRNIRCNTLLSVADIDRISNCSKHKAIFEIPVVDKKGISSYYQMKVTKCVTYDNPFQPITAIIGHLKVYNKNHILMEDRGVKDSAYVLTVNSEYVQYGSTNKSIPTISVAEIIEMLPDYISVEHYFGKWHIDGASMNVQYPHVVSEKLLRDALFEMLKWLKQNKII